MAEAERIKALGEASRVAGAVPGQPADDQHLARGDGLRQPALPRRRGAARDGPGVDDAAGCGRRATRDDPLHPDDGPCSPTRASRRCSAPTASRPTTATSGSASELTVTTRARLGRRARRTPAWARATSSPPATSGGTSATSRSRRCCSGCSSSSRRTASTGTASGPMVEPRHGVLLGGHRRRRAADPELQRLRRAAAPARAGLPRVRRARPRPRRRLRARHGLLVRRAPPPAGARQGAADRDRAGRPRGGRPDGRRGGRRGRTTRSRSGCRCGSTSSRIDDELTLPVWRRA